jgi:hypothetical protein
VPFSTRERCLKEQVVAGVRGDPTKTFDLESAMEPEERLKSIERLGTWVVIIVVLGMVIMGCIIGLFLQVLTAK